MKRYDFYQALDGEPLIVDLNDSGFWVQYADHLAELAQRDATIASLRAALKTCVDTLTDPRIGTWPYMDGSQIYSDFRKAALPASALLSSPDTPGEPHSCQTCGFVHSGLASPVPAQEAPGAATLTEVMGRLYASEINCRVSSFWDGGRDDAGRSRSIPRRSGSTAFPGI
jgi:hypothetical protein